MMDCEISTARVIPVYTVLPPHCLLVDVAGPLEVLRYANAAQSELYFELHFLAVSREQTTSIGLTLANLEPLPGALPEGAYVVISGAMTRWNDEPSEKAERHAISKWLAETVHPGVNLVTICSGALLAGAAGLLDGYECTTHADCIEQLQRIAPAARVLENRLYVEDGVRMSSAGISTGSDLMLQLVSRLTSPAVALKVARTMVIYMRRSGSDPQLSPWLSGRNHIHPSIHRAQDAIMGEPSADWSLGRLADVAHLSERHLSRLFREQTGMTVIDYVNLMRVTLVHDLLSQSRIDIEGIAERAGFASSRHLRRAWSRHYDRPPSHYRQST